MAIKMGIYPIFRQTHIYNLLRILPASSSPEARSTFFGASVYDPLVMTNSLRHRKWPIYNGFSH